jgi:hypothetical protein
MRTPIQENGSRNEWLRTFFRNCRCNSCRRHSYQLGNLIHMDAEFKYLLDPIFLFSLTLYGVNKSVVIRPYWWDCKFCNYYLNDSLLVPVLVPAILFFSRIVGCRKEHPPPMLREIVIPLAIWSIAFELIGPFCFGKGTSDPLDVLAYWAGGFLSWVIWNRRNFITR